VDNNWEDTNAEEIQAYIGILIYKDLINLPENEDYFFSSTNLMKMLLEQETYSCGTTRANRKNWQTEFRKATVFKFKRGESRKCIMKM